VTDDRPRVDLPAMIPRWQSGIYQQYLSGL
jgi:hypothetical protein